MFKPLDFLLDKSIYFSFDASGFIRHSSKFDEDPSIYDLSGKKYLVTGGSGGIGAASVQFLSKQGATVYYTGRRNNPPFNGSNHHYIIWDLIHWDGIDSLIHKVEPLDGIVLNAGGMPSKLEHNKWGYEYQFASQVMGHYFLVRRLRELGKLKPGARILWVTSGGMYLKRFDLSLAQIKEGYDKVTSYANAKRAQVIVVREMIKGPVFQDCIVGAMHPGWVNTDAVREAIPQFYSFTKDRLRTPEQGADCINWFMATNNPLPDGKLWFDRQEVPVYPIPGTKESTVSREKFIALLHDVYRFLFA